MSGERARQKPKQKPKQKQGFSHSGTWHASTAFVPSPEAIRSASAAPGWWSGNKNERLCSSL